MKKRFNLGRLGAVALSLTLITTCLMGGTLAKYTSTVEGNATAVTAKWGFEVNGQAETIENSISLANTAYKGVAENKIAPGTEGSFELNLDGSGSEVGIEYIITLEDANSDKTDGTNIPDGMVFSTKKIEGGNTGFSLTALATEEDNGLSGKIPYSTTASDMKETVTVYWKWNDAGEGSNDNGSAGKDWKINISVTGEQIAPEKSTTPAS